MNAVLKDAEPTRLLTRFGGITLLERQLHLLKRAGARRVCIAMDKPEMNELNFPSDFTVAWNSCSVEGPTLVLSANHLLRRKKLAALAAAGPGVYRDPNEREVLRVEPAATAVPVTLAPDDSMRLDQGEPNLSWLLQEARKESDSFMAKYFDRHISLSVTRLIINTSLSPTHMTLFSASIGLLGAAILAEGSFVWILAGALIIWLHTLLDGCDGELARLRYQETRLGGQLDFWGDNLIHFTLFSCLGIGRWRATGELPLLFLGLIAGASSLIAAWLIHRHTSQQEKDRKEGGPLFRGIASVAQPQAGIVRTLLTGMEDTLTQRDFIYLFVFMAAFNRPETFLWLAGIGTPLFILIFLSLQLANKK